MKVMKLQKEIEDLNKVLKTLQKKKEKLEDDIYNRENIFESRSEKWQDSDRGGEYQEKTEETFEDEFRAEFNSLELIWENLLKKEFYTKEQVSKAIELARQIREGKEEFDIEGILGLTEVQTSCMEMLYEHGEIIEMIKESK